MPDFTWTHLMLAATYSKMGREKEARAEAVEVMRIDPKFSLEGFTKRLPWKDQARVDRFSEACRKAGLK